jgi:lysylphosphatidylglycerol synthetase-like protein (DUF2156 family)
MPDERTQDGRRFVRREVVADDANLSRTANQLLTEELRDAIGTDEVSLPEDRARDAGRVGTREHRSLVTQLVVNRMLVGITFAMLVVVGVTASLATGSWWALVGAVAVHAVATFLVLSFTLQVTSEVEHVAPTTAARLEDEGVADPDQALSDLIEQYGPSDERHGATETVSGGHNEVSASPDEDPRRSAQEQRSAITPAGTPVGPSREGGAPALLPLLAVGASVIVGLVAAVAIGGIAWIGALLLVVAAVAWALLVRRIDAADRSARRSRVVAVVAVVVAGAVGVAIIVGAIAGYL